MSFHLSLTNPTHKSHNNKAADRHLLSALALSLILKPQYMKIFLLLMLLPNLSRPLRTTIAYLTDIEGDLNYLNRFLSLSRVLSVEDKKIHLAPNSHLVFGGDIVDRGGFDMSVLTIMNDLKDRYPDNVHFIMGNRDANKMRIRSEIKGDHGGVYWFRGTGREGDPEMGNVRGGTERMRFLLEKTMGCPDTFELRRNEIKILERREDVGDEEVVESFVDSCSVEGGMGRYFMRAEPVLRIGPVLFTHGGLPKPPEVKDPKDWGFSSIPPRFDRCNDFWDWYHGLRSWVDGQKSDYATGKGGNEIWATNGGYSDQPSGGGGLMQYGMGWIPGRKKNPTVIYSSWLQEGMPTSTGLDSGGAIRNIFEGGDGLKMVVCGHQPHGDAPLPIRVGGGEYMVLTGDTSYSGDCKWDGEPQRNPGRDGSFSGRGRLAVSEIIMEVNGGDIEGVNCHGFLSDGTEYDSGDIRGDYRVGVPATEEDFGSDCYIDGDGERWWVKCRISNDEYLGCHAVGWNVTNKVLKLLDGPEQ